MALEVDPANNGIPSMSTAHHKSEASVRQAITARVPGDGMGNAIRYSSNSLAGSITA